ncbi:hypothetical protein E4T56_gene5004 [Termitomyces sp. T112]|nr:hypothetical protein E4T56_gene5004 [Termitomyces sp. T112]
MEHRCLGTEHQFPTPVLIYLELLIDRLLSNMSKLFKGACFCGFISYEVTGPPILRAYCHCTYCQRLAGAPFVHSIHFPTTAFRWTHKQPDCDVLDSFVPPAKPHKTRYRCKNCGVCVASKNNLAGKTSVWATHLERDEKGALVHWDDLKPTAHIYYDTHVMDINDELSKWTGYENESEQIHT